MTNLFTLARANFIRVIKTIFIYPFSCIYRCLRETIELEFAGGSFGTSLVDGLEIVIRVKVF